MLENENGISDPEDVLPSFLCPITQMCMKDPVILDSGQTYDRSAIQSWIDRQNGPIKDPLTNVGLKRKDVTTNYALKNSIEEYQVEQKKLRKRRVEQKDQREFHQGELLIKWFEDMLYSKKNFDSDESFTKMMVHWFHVYKSCNGNSHVLATAFKRYVELLSCLDLDSLSCIRSTLSQLNYPLSCVNVILQYAEQKVTLPIHEQVVQLVERHHYFRMCVEKWFDSNIDCIRAVKSVFMNLVNESDSFQKECATYLNTILTDTNKTEMGETLRQIQKMALIYEIFMQPDIFDQHYRLYLANRLWYGFSKSIELEQKTISIFRQRFGFQLSNKLQGMVNDIQKPDFKHKLKKKGNFEFDVKICSASLWPCSDSLSYRISDDLFQSMKDFQVDYVKQFPQRKLTWHMNKGRAEVSVSFSENHTYTLLVTVYQMLVLLVFNLCSRVSFRQILDATGIPKSEVTHHLLSLAHPKVGVLLKRPNTKLIQDDHQFMLNPRYTHPTERVLVPLMSPTKNTENEEDEVRMLQQRYQIDNSIVCIMLTRKTLRHPNLIAEVLCRLKARFYPKITTIKKRIEALIAQEYLKRDEKDYTVYHYVN